MLVKLAPVVWVKKKYFCQDVAKTKALFHKVQCYILSLFSNYSKLSAYRYEICWKIRAANNPFTENFGSIKYFSAYSMSTLRSKLKFVDLKLNFCVEFLNGDLSMCKLLIFEVFLSIPCFFGPQPWHENFLRPERVKDGIKVKFTYKKIQQIVEQNITVLTFRYY